MDGLEQAIRHIEQYGSHHTDSIVTEDAAAAETFMHSVDSAIVLWNASTQFADGGEFGMGAEIGIGTGKMHARFVGSRTCPNRETQGPIFQRGEATSLRGEVEGALFNSVGGSDQNLGR